MLAVAVPPRAGMAETARVESTLELRLRKMADLDLRDKDEEPAVDEEDEEYHFLLLAGIDADWDNDIQASFKIQSQGLWAERDEGDRLETGIGEAFFDARSIGFLPISARLGRLRLQSGRGLLLSDAESAWGFDAADIAYDNFPCSYRILAGRTTRLSPETDIEWVGMAGLTHEPRTPFIRAISLYAAAADSYSSHQFYPLGARIETALNPQMDLWSEFAWEEGSNPEGEDLAAWIVDAGSEFRIMQGLPGPALTARATLASGASGDSRRDFEPLMDRDIGGVVLRPRLSNIEIFELGASGRPMTRARIECSLYGYRRRNPDEGVAGKEGWIYDGITAPASDSSRDLGWELDLGLEYAVDEHLTFRATAGYFKFGSAYDTVEDEYVLEGWLEMIWRY